MLYLDAFDRGYIERTPVTGVQIPSDINYLRRLYQFNKDSIETYYLERSFAVKNTHILSRFLEHLSPFLGYDVYRYLQYADDRTTYLSKHFKFTSDLEKGMIHPPYFFGNGGEEIILTEYETFDIQSFLKNWKLEPCIRVLTHPRNDTKLLLPLGNDNKGRGGLSVLVLNPLKLALKYREFMRLQAKAEVEGRPVLNKNFFIMRHVLNTTISDIADHLLLNKLMDKFYGRDEVTPKFKHRFKIYEPVTQINRYVDQTLNVITSKPLDFINILHNVQLLFNKDASTLLTLPGMSGTRQSKWALVVSRLEYMVFLYEVCKSKDMNKHHINDWKRLIARLERDSAMTDDFSYEVGSKVKELMYKVSQM